MPQEPIRIENGTEHEITGLDSNDAYRVHVRSVFGASVSEWSDPVLGYVSDTRPEHAFTFPLMLNWNPGAGGSTPVYEYVICNPVGTEAPASSSNALPTISEKRANEIRKGFAIWQEQTKWNNFWKNEDDYLIKVKERSMPCGVGSNQRANNESASEVKVLSQKGIHMTCGGSRTIGCASAPEIVDADGMAIELSAPAPASHVDVYIRYEASTDPSGPSQNCGENRHVAIHESGHALGLVGDKKRYHHPKVKDSIMAPELPPASVRQCMLTYYDTAALAAAYQGRFTVE